MPKTMAFCVGVNMDSQIGAAKERTRVQSLKTAFDNLQSVLPFVPPGTKLSKLDVLQLARAYIGHLQASLVKDDQDYGGHEQDGQRHGNVDRQQSHVYSRVRVSTVTTLYMSISQSIMIAGCSLLLLVTTRTRPTNEGFRSSGNVLYT